MKNRLTILAVLAMAVCISSTAASAADWKAAKPAKAAKAAKAQPIKAAAAPLAVPAASVSATLTDTTLTLSGINLTPGTRYAFTFQVWTIDSPYAYWRGGSDGMAVNADGNYSVTMDIADLTKWAGSAGLDKVVMWLRPANSLVDDVSVNADGAPLLTEQDFGA